MADEKFTSIRPECNFDVVALKADKQKRRILAIANGEIVCSYHDAMQEVSKYESLLPQMQDGYLFLAAAKCLIVDHFRNCNKDDAGTSL